MYIFVYPLTHIQTCTVWFLLTVAIAYNSGYCLEKQMKFGGRMVGNFKKILLSKMISYMQPRRTELLIQYINVDYKVKINTEHCSTTIYHKNTQYHIVEHFFCTVSNSLMLWTSPCLNVLSMWMVGNVGNSLPLQSSGNNLPVKKRVGGHLKPYVSILDQGRQELR